MKILILNGSPHLDGPTSDMARAFAEGAKEAGHEVVSVNVAHKNIRGCMACEYCRNKEKGICAQKDDMAVIYEKVSQADMLVIASPVYFYGISAQLKALVDRLHTPMRNAFSIRRLGLILVGAREHGAVWEVDFEDVLLVGKNLLAVRNRHRTRGTQQVEDALRTATFGGAVQFGYAAVRRGDVGGPREPLPAAS